MTKPTDLIKPNWPDRTKALYVHVPFCVRKCDYCAFYSVPLNKPFDAGNSFGRKDFYGCCTDENIFTDKSLVSQYLKGLEIEAGKVREDASAGVSSLFLGGGTPTALTAEALDVLLTIIEQSFIFTESAERTVEGNPGTLTKEKLQILKKHGINRFSLGVQALDDSLLQRIGRIHNAEEVCYSIKLLRSEGFVNLNLDLMFGLPGQTLELWEQTLDEVLSFQPEHLSVYGLILEEGTPLGEKYLNNTDYIAENDFDYRQPLLPDDDLQAEMYALAVERLKAAGYNHYETSNFARRGYECRHNLHYWQGHEYLGLGPGGVSCLNMERWKNIEDISRYTQALAEDKSVNDPDESETLTLRDLMVERIMLGLRMSRGINLKEFKNDFGKEIRDIYPAVVERYEKLGILIFNGQCLRLNPDYMFVANSILQEFV